MRMGKREKKRLTEKKTISKSVEQVDGKARGLGNPRTKGKIAI